MKNVYLLIFILIFLYIICNRYIEKFSVGCQISEQGNGQGNDNKINISGSLTLSNKCSPTSPPKCPIESGLLNQCSDINSKFNIKDNITNCSDFFENKKGIGYKCKTGSNSKTCVIDLNARCTPPQSKKDIDQKNYGSNNCNNVGWYNANTNKCQCPGTSSTSINPKGYTDGAKYYIGNSCEHPCNYEENGYTLNCPCGDDSSACGNYIGGKYKCSGKSGTNKPGRFCI